MILFFRPMRGAGHRLADIAVGVALGVAGAAIAAGRPGGATGGAASEFAGSPAVAGGVAARALAVVDGDTFEARVTAFPGQEIVARIRIDGLDAPERAGRCAAETAAAKAAAEALAALIKDRRLTLTAVRGDKFFGRVVARVATDETADVAGALIAEGHGRAYRGGRRGGWC